MKTSKILLCSLIVCSLLTACGKDKPTDKNKSTPATAAQPAKDKTNQQQPAAANATPVNVITVQQQQIQLKYKSNGSLKAVVNPTIRADSSGKIESVSAYGGEAVKINQVLAKLSSRKQAIAYQQALAKIKSAQATLHEKAITRESKGELEKTGIVSKLEYTQAQADEKVAEAQLNEAQQDLIQSENELERTIVRSPIDGSVEKIYVSQGDYVNQGDKLFTLINHSVLEANLPFSQAMAGKFQIGQEVHLFSPATPGKEYIGQVTAIIPSIDPSNRSINVIVAFESENLWHSGATITGQIFLEQKYSAFVAPIEATVLTSKGFVIYTVEDGKAVEHPIQILQIEDNDQVDFTSNIKSGDVVVTVGAAYLTDGAPVKIQQS